MNIELFTNPRVLRVGNLVVGPSALVEISRIVAALPQVDEQSMREECNKRKTPLYEIVSITKERCLWFKKHYVRLRRISDGTMREIDLKSPKNDFFARSPSVDIRENWAQLDFQQ